MALVYGVEESGVAEEIDYYEEIGDLWDYMSSDYYAGYSYFLRSNYTDYGCKFVKIRLDKDDYFIYDFGADSNAGLGYIFSNEDLCSTGFGCEISWEFPYNASSPASNTYDLVAVGQLCKHQISSYYFQPSGLAWDENAFTGDGICSLEFEYYKGDFDDQPCRISPTWYAVYSAEGLTGYAPLLLGIGFGLLVFGAIFISIGYSKKQSGDEGDVFTWIGIIAIIGFGLLLLFHISVKNGLIAL